MKPKSKVLIIAGSDSSGGAGIQADIKTVTALGSYAMTAVTAVTAQNTKGVKKITPIPTTIVQKQITMVLDDIGANAAKIGMLHNTSIEIGEVKINWEKMIKRSRDVSKRLSKMAPALFTNISNRLNLLLKSSANLRTSFWTDKSAKMYSTS